MPRRMLDSSEVDVAIVQLLEVGDVVRPTDVVCRRDELHAIQGLDVDLTYAQETHTV